MAPNSSTTNREDTGEREHALHGQPDGYTKFRIKTTNNAKNSSIKWARTKWENRTRVKMMTNLMPT